MASHITFGRICEVYHKDLEDTIYQICGRRVEQWEMIHTRKDGSIAVYIQEMDQLIRRYENQICAIVKKTKKVIVGFRVPAKPLRFEHWGAREDLSLPDHALCLTTISKASSTNPQHKRHEVYTGSGHRCGVIPYSSVVVVDCLSS